MRFVNLTPHEVVLRGPRGDERIPPDGRVVRVPTHALPVPGLSDELGYPVHLAEHCGIKDMPDPEPDTVFIVSLVVLQALKEQHMDRSDCVAPDTAPHSAIRDAEGRIVAVKGFVVV